MINLLDKVSTTWRSGDSRRSLISVMPFSFENSASLSLATLSSASRSLIWRDSSWVTFSSLSLASKRTCSAQGKSFVSRRFRVAQRKEARMAPLTAQRDPVHFDINMLSPELVQRVDERLQHEVNIEGSQQNVLGSVPHHKATHRLGGCGRRR